MKLHGHREHSRGGVEIVQLAEHHACVMKRVEILRIDFDDRLELLGRFLKFSSYEKRG